MSSVVIFENDKIAYKITLLIRQYIEMAVFSIINVWICFQSEINYLEMACCWPVPKEHDMIIYVLQDMICVDAPSWAVQLLFE